HVRFGTGCRHLATQKLHGLVVVFGFCRQRDRLALDVIAHVPCARFFELAIAAAIALVENRTAGELHDVTLFLRIHSSRSCRSTILRRPLATTGSSWRSIIVQICRSESARYSAAWSTVNSRRLVAGFTCKASRTASPTIERSSSANWSNRLIFRCSLPVSVS